MVKAIFNKQQNDKAKQQDLYLKIYNFVIYFGSLCCCCFCKKKENFNGKCFIKIISKNC